MRDTAVLLIDCPDRKGLVAAVASLLYRFGANITHADQHQDHEAGLFFMRVEWMLDGFDLPAFRAEFQITAAELHMRWQLKSMSEVQRVAIFVSQYLHCLVDILHRYQTGELNCTIPIIVSNHREGEALARFHGIEFRYLPMTRETRPEREEEQRRILRAEGIDLVVWRATCKSCRRILSRSTRRGSSMSITRSCPHSLVRGLTTRLFTGESS